MAECRASWGQESVEYDMLMQPQQRGLLNTRGIYQQGSASCSYLIHEQKALFEWRALSQSDGKVRRCGLFLSVQAVPTL